MCLIWCEGGPGRGAGKSGVVQNPSPAEAFVSLINQLVPSVMDTG